MLHAQTKKHILNLSDPQLLQYVLIGQRMYEPEAVAFAQQELDRRNLDPTLVAMVRPAIIRQLAHYDATASIDVTKPPVPAILCQHCNLEVPLRYFAYDENIGVFIARVTTRYRGFLCKKCSRHFFLKSTITTAILGWFGVISFFVTLFTLPQNIVLFYSSRSMPPVPKDARPPILTQPIVDKITPHLDAITEQLAQGNNINDIARALAPRAKVTPGEMFTFIRTMIETKKIQPPPQAHTYAFPVVQSKSSTFG